jgi:hypothetical protein
VTHRKARVQLPAAHLDPSGRARLSYQQAGTDDQDMADFRAFSAIWMSDGRNP